MRLIFKTAQDLSMIDTHEFDNMPCEVISIYGDSWHVRFPNGKTLHAFVDELFIV